MIAKLTGNLDGTGPDWAILDVAGVGYLVSASARTLATLPAPGAPATLHTEMLVSDDAIRLLGFATAAERDWFRQLTAVQGVGAKVALAILSALAPDELARAVASGDKASIGRAQGVGPKLAARIANELRDRVPALGPGAAAPAPAGGADADAVSALQNLGFRPAEAATAVAAAREELGVGATLDALVRLALRKAAR